MPARAAFTESVHSSLTALGAVTAISAVLIGAWAPGRDGRQLAILRRLRGQRPGGRHRRRAGA